MEVSDERLVRLCRDGDDDAWREFVERFSRYVYAIIGHGFRLRGGDAEDVFQDVFAKAYEHLGRLRDDTAVRPWLAQLTRRACIDRIRAQPQEESAGEELEPAAFDETLPGDPRPVLRPGRELSHDRRGARTARRDDRQPDLPLSRPAP